MTTPCMGGWCSQRNACAHHVDPSQRKDPAERLCPPGDEQPVPMAGRVALEDRLAEFRRRFGSILAGMSAEQQAAFEREMVR